MNISIEVPDEVADQIGTRWNDLTRATLEALVAVACREKVLSEPQAQEMLGFDSRFELDAFLNEKRGYLDYSEDDLASGIRTLDVVSREPGKRSKPARDRERRAEAVREILEISESAGSGSRGRTWTRDELHDRDA